MAQDTYIAVTNIPSHFHAADLRAHFSSFVEDGSFLCFHFRHRPEKPKKRDDDNGSTAQNHDMGDDKNRLIKDVKKSKMCCVIKVVKLVCEEFIHKYNENNWTDVHGQYLSDLCQLSDIKLKIATPPDQNHGEESETNKNGENQIAVAEKDLLSMPELLPPDVMPNGNVGTPTLVFLDSIQKCLLPNNIVNKLQLKFPSTSAKRIYSNVNYEYNDSLESFSKGRDTTQNQDKKVHVMSMIDRKKCFKASLGKNENFTVKSKDVGSSDISISSSSSSVTESNIICPKGTCSLSKQLDDVSEISGSHSSSYPLSQLNKTDIGTKSNAETETALNSPHSVKLALSQKRPLTHREKKLLKKEERRRTKALMDEGIEERLIQVEKRYHNEDDAEEWDRHEAVEDDPSNQERNKERLFEEEIEQPWEKGGPGVVFYTDAIYWQAQDGDFDEQTADDLDVDFSPYEGDGPGDKDIQDFLKIRQEKRFRDGYDNTDRYSIGLSKRLDSDQLKFKTPSVLTGATVTVRKPGVIGQFERHTKGFGRKLMEKQGWQEGQGLGASCSGIKDALKGAGQRPRVKKGLGYVADEPVRYGASVMKKARLYMPPTSHLITTSKDDPSVTDPKEALLQRNEATTLKHRKTFLDKQASKQ